MFWMRASHLMFRKTRSKRLAATKLSTLSSWRLKAARRRQSEADGYMPFLEPTQGRIALTVSSENSFFQQHMLTFDRLCPYFVSVL